MSKFESTVKQPAEPVSSPTAVDVIAEFASSAYRSGVARPLAGLAQLADSRVQLAPEPEKQGALKYANMAGSAAGTLADIILLSRFVGKGVTALGEKTGAQSLIEAGTTRNMTVAGATGFADGFALTPQQKGETLNHRFAHGIAEGAGFMALEGSTKLLSRLPENAITNAVGKTGGFLTRDFGAVTPAWASEAGRNATSFLGRNAAKVGEYFPSLTRENIARNAVAGFVGGDVAFNVDAALTGKKLDVTSGEGSAFGWAAVNALLGGKSGMRVVEGQPKETFSPRSEKIAEPEPVKVEVPPPKQTFTPETKILENGHQQWTYRDVPAKGDETVYINNNGPILGWHIKKADGRVIDRHTEGPWEINYPDGAIFSKDRFDNFAYTKPMTVELAGKELAVKEVTFLQPDQNPVGRRWVYEDPAVPNQIVRLKSDKTWEAVTPDGQRIWEGSEGPWKVTTLDGQVATKQAGSSVVDIQPLNANGGKSDWLEKIGPNPDELFKPRTGNRPFAIRLSAEDMSPMSLSEGPRRTRLSTETQF